MPEYFKKQGYLTYGAGKLYHPGSPADNDFTRSWTQDDFNPVYFGNNGTLDAGHCSNDESELAFPISEWHPMNISTVCTVTDTSEEGEYDHIVASRTIDSLRHVKQASRNFFVAAGFIRPHLDWRVPARFWNMYHPKDIELAKHQTIGTNVTKLEFERNSRIGAARHTKDGKSFFRISPDGPPLPDELQRLLRRAYYASVSFLDFQVGRILEALDELGLTDSTAVLLHGDHGWKLGEHGDWSKCTNWETDTRVPLIVRAPWLEGSAGTRSPAIAELVDIFPTLVELSGLEAVPASEGLEGKSLMPALQQPDCEGCLGYKPAFSQYPRCPQYSLMNDAPTKWECLYEPKANITRMGYSVRVPDARYTEWRVWQGEKFQADWSVEGLVAQELYDHTGDLGLGPASFDDYEYVNVVFEAGRAAQVQALAKMILTQFAPHVLVDTSDWLV